MLSFLLNRPIAALAVMLPLAGLTAACGSDGGAAAGGDGTDTGAAQSDTGGSQTDTGVGSDTQSGGDTAIEDTNVDSDVPDAPPRIGPAPVRLGSAGGYAILAKSAISNVPTSAITGDIGLSPAATSYITGLPLTRAGIKWTTPQVVGGVFGADNDPPTPINLTTAVANMETAYTDAAGRPTPDFLNLGGGTVDGLTLAPGLYKWTSSVTITTSVTIAGAPNDVWIFQVSGDLKLANAKRMTLSGGARARNVFWQVTGTIDLGTTSHSEGVMLAKTDITLETGASIHGRLLSQTAVSLDAATVTQPAP